MILQSLECSTLSLKGVLLGVKGIYVPYKCVFHLNENEMNQSCRISVVPGGPSESNGICATKPYQHNIQFVVHMSPEKAKRYLGGPFPSKKKPLYLVEHASCKVY